MIIVDCKTSISGQISQLAYLKLSEARITAKNYNFTFAKPFAESAPLIRQDFLAREYLIGHMLPFLNQAQGEALQKWIAGEWAYDGSRR